jgi:hypothetical protein
MRARILPSGFAALRSMGLRKLGQLCGRRPMRRARGARRRAAWAPAQLARHLALAVALAPLASLSAFGCADGLGCEELDLDGCYATPGCQYIEENDICAPPDGAGCFYVEETECPAGTVGEVVAGGDGRGGCNQAFRCADPNAPEGGATAG